MAKKAEKVEVEVTETEEEKTKREEEEKKAKELEDRKKALENEIVKDGDMVMVDILGKTLEEDPTKNMIFQASNEEDAHLLPNYDPKNAGRYTNDLAIIGKTGFLQDKIDEAIKDKVKYYEEKTIDLEAIDAFGEREGNKIEKVSEKQFRKDMKDEKPYPGAQYTDKKGRNGVVLRVGQGRLLVDFNHPLAGKKVQYRIKVTDRIEGFENQCKAFLSRRLGGAQMFGEMFKINHIAETKTLEIEIPQMLSFQLAQQQGGIYFKMGVSMDLQENLPNVDTVKFIEVYSKTPAPIPGEHNHEHDHEHEHNHE